MAHLGTFKTRDRELLLQDILSAILSEGETSKSYLMRRARLSYAQQQIYFKYLTEKGCIAMHQGRIVITQKGARLLDALREKEKILHS